MANLPTDHSAIAKALTKRGKKLATPSPTDHKEPQTMEGALPAAEAEPGTLKVSLAATPSMYILQFIILLKFEIGLFTCTCELLQMENNRMNSDWFAYSCSQIRVNFSH